MGRKPVSVPNLSELISPKPCSGKPSLWEGVRGSVRTFGERLPSIGDRLPALGERLPALGERLPALRKRSEERLQRKLSEASLVSEEDKIDERLSSSIPSSLHSNDDSSSRPDERGEGRTRRRDDSRLRDRLSMILPNYGNLENRVKNVKKDLVRLRSKSCDRILRRRRGRVSPAPEPVFDEEYFNINSTLRRSRRQQECRSTGSYSGGYTGCARAKVDCVPSPYDTLALPFKTGDRIRIIQRNPSGLWLGECRGRTGHFKFINVEEIEPIHTSDTRISPEVTVTGLLCRLELAHLTSRLVLHGWDTLARLRALQRRDLVYLGVEDRTEQDTLLAALAGIHGDYNQSSNPTIDQSINRSLNKDSHRLDSGYFDLRDSDDVPRASSRTSSLESGSSGSADKCSRLSSECLNSKAQPRVRENLHKSRLRPSGTLLTESMQTQLSLVEPSTRASDSTILSGAEYSSK